MPKKEDALVKFSDFVQFPLKCLKVFGSVPYDADPVDNWKKKLFRIYHYVAIINMSFSQFCTGLYIKQHAENLTLVTIPAPGAVYACLGIVKVIQLLFRKEEFKDLMETLNDLLPKTKSEQERYKVKEKFEIYKSMQTIFSRILMSVGASFSIVPFLKLALTGVWYDKLPYESWYPFDEYDRKFYNIAFVWQINNTIVAISSLLGPDLILYAFISLICMQFDILCQHLTELEDVPQDEAYKKIDELIEFHKTLIRLSNNLQKTFSVSILVNFMGSSVIICLVGIELTGKVDAENMTKFCIYLVASVSQILMLCNHGNKLTTASENVVKAAYFSGWHQNNIRKYKTPMVLMMQRSQKPSVISAYKFSVVSLEAFSTVSLWYDWVCKRSILKLF